MAMVVTVAVSFFLLALPLTVYRFVLTGIQRYDIANAILLGRIISHAFDRGVAQLPVRESTLSPRRRRWSPCCPARCRSASMPPPCFWDLRFSRRQVSLSLLKAMLPYSLQVFVIGIAALVILQADSLIIGVYIARRLRGPRHVVRRVYQACAVRWRDRSCSL